MKTSALTVTFDEGGAYKRPARFYIWRGDVLMALSNCQYSPEELRATGHLFAAAPEMRAALTWAHNELTRDGFVCNGDCDICKAIDKAEAK